MVIHHDLNYIVPPSVNCRRPIILRFLLCRRSLKSTIQGPRADQAVTPWSGSDSTVFKIFPLDLTSGHLARSPKGYGTLQPTTPTWAMGLQCPYHKQLEQGVIEKSLHKIKPNSTTCSILTARLQNIMSIHQNQGR